MSSYLLLPNALPFVCTRAATEKPLKSAIYANLTASVLFLNDLLLLFFNGLFISLRKSCSFWGVSCLLNITGCKLHFCLSLKDRNWILIIRFYILLNIQLVSVDVKQETRDNSYLWNFTSIINSLVWSILRWFFKIQFHWQWISIELHRI